jgi:hypothetical protein
VPLLDEPGGHLVGASGASTRTTPFLVTRNIVLTIP